MTRLAEATPSEASLSAQNSQGNPKSDAEAAPRRMLGNEVSEALRSRRINGSRFGDGLGGLRRATRS